MKTIPFVDAHVHLWDLDHLTYPWLTPPFADDGPNGSVASIAQTYLPDDYRQDAANWNVAGYVHVDAGADASDALRETEWLNALPDGPNGIVAFAALDDPDLEPLLAAHAAHARVRGIRQIVNWHVDGRRTYTQRDMTGDDAWAHGFALLAKYDLSFDLQAYPGQFAGLANVIDRNPGVPVVINHLGMPVTSDPDHRTIWSEGLTLLAELPNVAIKISGFGFIQRFWTAEDARPWVLEAIDIFGPDRVCAASDFPTDKLFGSFDETLGAHAHIIAGFSDHE